MARREAFNFAILDADESHLLGCIYLDPPGHEIGCDVVVSWWVVDTHGRLHAGVRAQPVRPGVGYDLLAGHQPTFFSMTQCVPPRTKATPAPA